MPDKLKLGVFISSTMSELRDVREVLARELSDRGLEAWIYEAQAGARPESITHTSLAEVERADLYVGLFYKQFGAVTAEEYRRARALGKPCFVYIRDQSAPREEALDRFLRDEVHHLKTGVSSAFFASALDLAKRAADDIMAWFVARHRQMTAELANLRLSRYHTKKLKSEVNRLRQASRNRLPIGTQADYLAQTLRIWFQILDYTPVKEVSQSDTHFEWLLSVPSRRGASSRMMKKKVC